MGLFDGWRRASPDQASSVRSDRQRTGDAAEDAALSYLRDRGLELVERNFRCKGGEIDLIMREGETLVFIEVRARAGDSHGGAAASITPAKQRRLVIAAQHYLQRYRFPPACRFDVIALEGGRMDWLRNVIGT